MATSTDTTNTGSDYYVSETGTIQQQSNPIAAIALKASGYSGPYDWAEAKSVANNVIERIGLGEVNAATGATTGESTNAASSANASNPLDYLKNIGDFFTEIWSVLTNESFYIRAAKVVVGGVMIIVCVAQMTGADKALKEGAKAAFL